MTRVLLLELVVGTGLITGPVMLDSLQAGADRIATPAARTVNAAPAQIRPHALGWGRVNDQSPYAASTVLLTRPPREALAPGEAQGIRLIAEKLPGEGGERAFRLVID